MRQSKILTLELEVDITWDEDRDGTKVYVSSECQTKVPITVSAWAEHSAWMKLTGAKS